MGTPPLGGVHPLRSGEDEMFGRLVMLAACAALSALPANAHPPELDVEIAGLDRLLEDATPNPYIEGAPAWLLAESERGMLLLVRAGLLATRVEQSQRYRGYLRLQRFTP